MSALRGPQPGEIVTATVTRRLPWGVVLDVRDYPGVLASIDMFSVGAQSSDVRDYPAPGAVLEAVVLHIRRQPELATNYRLSHLAPHVEHARQTGSAPPPWDDIPTE